MRYFIILLFCSTASLCLAQTEYSRLVRSADSLYRVKDYKSSALVYSSAFKANGWKASFQERYNAGCSWALAGNADSAFFQLDRIARRANYKNVKHLTSDPDLFGLHADKRWLSLVELVQQNKDKAEANLNKPLVRELDSILVEDQRHRAMLESTRQKYGSESAEMKHLKVAMRKTDSLNVTKVAAILDENGWLGEDVVGPQGNHTLFLVIQHADPSTQEKYLPMLREAVKNGKAKGDQLALLEDRVALHQGKKQIYGSQISIDPSGKGSILPIEDERNVNQRRSSVGLEPLEDYARRFNIEYKLPAK